MIQKRIEELEKKSKKKTTKYKDFNFFYEDLKNGDVDTVASFDSLYEDLEFPDIIRRKA